MSLKQTANQFLKHLLKFDYKLSEFGDPYWEVLFPTAKGKWQHLLISNYQKNYYLHHSNGNKSTLEVVIGESLKMETDNEWEEKRQKKKWLQLLEAATKWLKEVEQDWITTNIQVQKDYPLKYRYGLIENRLLQSVLPEVIGLAEKLGKAKTQQFVELVEQGFFKRFDKPQVENMTAGKYFEYCKIAYLATEEHADKNLTGKELYKIYADGRHEGLMDIALDSEAAFSDWLDGKHPKRGGGHPWEIKRGGSSTHIGMRVQRPRHKKKCYTIELYGHSSYQLANTIKMFLAIYEVGLPVHIVYPNEIRKRLLGQDRVGIIPTYDSLSSGEGAFDTEEEIYDTLYYQDLKGYKKTLRPFIKWSALPVLKIREF